MISDFFHLVIFTPLYNGLAFFLDIVPWGDAGLAIIGLTVLVRIVLFPVAQKAIKNQVRMRKIEPEVAALREKYKNDKPKLAQETMALYKSHGIKFTANIQLLLIQLPVILGLYFVFLRGGLPEIQPDLLYAFIPAPEVVRMEFLNLLDLSQKSILLAGLAGVSQHIFTRLSFPEKPKPENAQQQQQESLQDEMARRMRFMFLYPMPVMIAVFAYVFSGAVALYWVTSNVFSIGQEYFVRRRIERQEQTYGTAPGDNKAIT